MSVPEMAAKHTPGPWRVYSRFEEEKNYECSYIGTTRPGEVLAQVYGNALPSHKANALLISASPDLLEAVKPIAEELTNREHSAEYLACDNWNPEAHIEITVTIAEARRIYKAIAKAEGRS